MSRLYRERIVVKVGTSTLINDTGKVDLRSLDAVARVLADLNAKGYRIVLVSSGAIAAGSSCLGGSARLDTMQAKQAAAAVGQCRIIMLYDKFFDEYDTTIAQILLGAEDVAHAAKRRCLTNTFDALLSQGVVPVVNENDSVSPAEIESEERLFGDNDVLSAIVAVLCRASRLVILSDIEGLYDKDPRRYPDAQLVGEVERIDDAVRRCAGGAGTRRGTGGMKTKIEAAALATREGIDVSIVHGAYPALVYDVIEGRPAGTLFRGTK